MMNLCPIVADRRWRWVAGSVLCLAALVLLAAFLLTRDPQESPDDPARLIALQALKRAGVKVTFVAEQRMVPGADLLPQLIRGRLAQITTHARVEMAGDQLTPENVELLRPVDVWAVTITGEPPEDCLALLKTLPELQSVRCRDAEISDEVAKEIEAQLPGVQIVK